MPPTTLPHPQGSVAWIDTLLARQDELLRFYQPLLGWSGQPDPNDPNRYAVQSVDGSAVAGVGAMPETEPFMPWTGYFAVDDAEATAGRIEQLGGGLIVGATNAGDMGRFAHGTDPGGAAFGLWQALSFPGIGRFGEPGCLDWFELVTTEGKSSAEFYGALLGAVVEPMAEMPDSYWTLQVDGQPRAGILNVDSLERAFWRPYFNVANVDAAVEAAVKAGAQLKDKAMDSPFGRMAGLIDPLGIEIRLISPPWT